VALCSGAPSSSSIGVSLNNPDGKGIALGQLLSSLGRVAGLADICGDTPSAVFTAPWVQSVLQESFPAFQPKASLAPHVFRSKGFAAESD
jgi:hypothetical protein